jgi:glycosyltransferase involved in cell wall biosynthesis
MFFLIQKYFIQMSNNEAKISIVLTLFNADKFLKQCFDSILSQDYYNTEIIAVINGISSDSTEDIVLDYSKKDSRVKICFNKIINNTICDGLRVGFSNVTGEYFTVVDGDDFLLPGALRNLYNKIIADQSDIVVGNMLKVNMAGEVYGKIGLPEFNCLDREKYLVPSFWYMDFFPHGKLYKANLLTKKEITYLPVSIGTDILLHYQLVLNSDKVSRCNKDVHCYRINANSISHTMTLKKLEDSFNCYLFLDKLFNKSSLYKNKEAMYAFKSQGLILAAECLLIGRNDFYDRYRDDVNELLEGMAFKQDIVKKYLKGWPQYYYVIFVYKINRFVGNYFCFILNVIRQSGLRNIYLNLKK